MDPLTNPAFLIFSALLPVIIALVKQSGLSTQFNAIIALAAYIVVGVVGAFMSGEDFTAENAVTFITVATTVGTVAYNLVWKNLGPEDDPLEGRLNDATSFIKPSSDGEPTPPTQ